LLIEGSECRIKHPDPPESFAEAETRFNKFLAGNNFPSNIRWILADQIALTTNRGYLILAAGAIEGRKEAERRYVAGLAKGLGISLNAICVTPEETIASVYVPKDLVDAQRHLMGPGFKFLCPVEKLAASMISEVSEWERLDYDIQVHSRMMRENLEL
jgi:hypothetical protein